jgi:hypothetical protein
MEVALQAVDVQKTSCEEDQIGLQTMWQNAVGMDTNSTVPNPMAAAALVNVPLKQWIKCAILSIGTNDGKNAFASLKFLQPALAIATCLAEQISRTEITVNMIANWAKYVVVWVKHDGCANVQMSPAKFSVLRHEEKEPDLKQQLEELLESCVHGSEISDVARS